MFVRVCPCVIWRRWIVFVHDITLNNRIICVAGRDVVLPQLLSEKKLIKPYDYSAIQFYKIISISWFNLHHTNLIFLRILFRCLCLSIWSAVSIPLSVENSFSSYSMIVPSSIWFSSDVISSYSSYNKLLVSTENNKGFVLKFIL